MASILDSNLVEFAVRHQLVVLCNLFRLKFLPVILAIVRIRKSVSTTQLFPTSTLKREQILYLLVTFGTSWSLPLFRDRIRFRLRGACPGLCGKQGHAADPNGIRLFPFFLLLAFLRGQSDRRGLGYRGGGRRGRGGSRARGSRRGSLPRGGGRGVHVTGLPLLEAHRTIALCLLRPKKGARWIQTLFSLVVVILQVHYVL